MTFDTTRFCWSLAGALAGGEWTEAVLQQTFREKTGEHAIRIPGLVRRVLARFPQAPHYVILFAFLVGDDGVERALARKLGRPAPRRRRFRTRPPKMGKPPAWLPSAETPPPLATEAALAAWLGVSDGRLRWYADLTGRNRKHPPGPRRTYRHRWVPKPGGRSRLLEIPKYELKRIQRKILAEILNRVPPHPAAHGFRPGRSAVTNASEHCGRPVVVRFDLADFFPSVPAARVVGIFRTLGYPQPVARLLTGLCTTRLPADVWDSRPNPAADGSDHATRLRFAGRHLPQGAPTSPALANLAAHRLDRRLSRLAERLDATYTRYADDLTFSGGERLARGAKRLAVLVAVVAGEEGFALNFRKTRVTRRSRRQTVTGVVVNARPNLPRADFDRLKAILTNCARHGPAGQNRDGRADFRAHLAGRVAHLAAVNPARGRKLWAIFDRIAWPAPPPPAWS